MRPILRSSRGTVTAALRMAWSVDRLGRSLQDLVGFLSELHAMRIEVRQRLDSASPRLYVAGDASAYLTGGLHCAVPRIRHRRYDESVFMWAFDLIELDADDLRLEPLGARKATLARVLARAAPGLRLNEHMMLQARSRGHKRATRND